MSFDDFSAGLSSAFKSGFDFSGLFLVTLIFIGMFGLIFFAVSLPIMEKYFAEKELYEFIIDFKSLTQSELGIIESIIKKHRLKEKYRFLTSPVLFDKYVNMEIVSIEESNLSPSVKHEKINFYIMLKKKLFHTDK